LSADTTRASLGWEIVRLDANAVEIQTEERNGLLLGTSHGWSLRVIPGDHTEVVGEDGGLSRLVGIEVVDDRASINEFEGSIRILEVQLREPVGGLVLLNATRGTFGFSKVIRGRDFDSEVGTTYDSVDMRRDNARV
jgi:hypothetical protein